MHANDPMDTLGAENSDTNQTTETLALSRLCSSVWERTRGKSKGEQNEAIELDPR